jgi:2-polyprenyl-6-methoxyphenol hydroxylase-like FAD-dependent oxidoreductase
MPESQISQPIVIVGAGPVGLFAAVLLVRAGYRVTVLEKNSHLAMDMRASTFHPATLDLLSPLGLADPLVARGSITQGWQYMIHGTKKHAVFDLDSISDLTDHPFRLQCEQFHFSNIAVEFLVSSPLFQIRFGHELLEVEDHGNEVHLQIRSPVSEYGFTTPWLIVADGGRSAVRKHLGLVFEGSVFPRTSIALVLNHPFQHDIPGLLGVNYVWTESGYYGLMQIRDLWRFYYSPDPEQSVEEALSEPVAQSRLQAVFPANEPYELLQRNHYTLQQRCLESFRVGRILFAGDAAHLDSPAGGMGMNGGMHDAQCLVEHLVPVLQGADDSLLDRYSRRRRTIALEEVQRLSARNYRWHRETDPEQREHIWQELQEIVNDRDKTRDFLLNSSMIRSRQREKEID